MARKRDDSTPRPLKVVLQKKEDKRKIMTRLAKLKDAEDLFKSISMSDDLTKDEHEQVKRRVQEAKELKKNQGEGGLWKFYVRDPPWNLQIRKTKVNIPTSAS